MALLSRVPLFAGTDDHLLGAVADLAEEVAVRESEVLFEKGDAGDCMFIVASGRLRLEDGHRTLDYLGERDVFGEMAALASAPRVATVRAVEDSVLLRLDQKRLLQLMQVRSEIALGLIRILSGRLRDRIAELRELQGRYEALQGTLRDRTAGETRTLLAYVPIDRRRAMARGEDLPGRAWGSVLFLDISGFTPLTGLLAEDLGPRRGAEELTIHLNRVFGAMIDEIHRSHGSVIGFSGDAMTCWFDRDDGRTATACGLRMQQVMGWSSAVRTPSGATVPLAVKVGVAAGPVRRFLVGDPQVQVYEALAGATLDRVEAAEGLAKEGEVVVSREVVEKLGEEVRLTGERVAGSGETAETFYVVGGLSGPVSVEPWPVSVDEPLGEELVRPWLPAATYERLRGGQGEFLAELRPAVAVFLKFAGIDYDGEDDAGRQLDAYIRWAQRILERHGGSLIDLTNGDKGSYFYISFGAPVAVERPAERALAAALELIQPPPAMGFVKEVRIGVSQGRMRGGAYGGPTRRIYGLLGSEANMAARLMTRALPGQILIRDSLVESTAARFVFKDLGRLSVKGKRESIPVFQLLGARRKKPPKKAPPPPAALVGREEERRFLFERLADLRKEGSSIVHLDGETGIGKSRLLLELMEEARRSPGVVTFFLQAGTAEKAAALAAWRPVFEAVLDLERGGAVGARKLLEKWFPQAGEKIWLDSLPLLNAVVPLDLEETAVTRALEGAQRAERTHRLLVQVLRKAAGARPVVLLIDDAAFLDTPSWALLTLVAKVVRPLLLVLALRRGGEEPPEESWRVLKAPQTRTLRLSGLSVEETRALVSRRLGVEDVPRPLAELIHKKAGGNPYFSSELAHALLEKELIRIKDGICRSVRHLNAVELPDTVEGIVTSRVDHLEPSLEMVLKVASVIGREFAVTTLADVYPVESERKKVPAYLKELARLGLVTQELGVAEPLYSFKDPATRDVIYNLLLFAQRRQIHRSLAEWYERHQAEHLETVYSLLAYHWSGAMAGVEDAEPREVSKTVDYLLQASRQALHEGASQEGLENLSRGLQLLERLPASRERDRQELGLRSALGRVLREVEGPAADVERNFDRALELSKELNEIPQLFAALHGLWTFHLVQSSEEMAVRVADQLYELAKHTEDRQFLIAAHDARGTNAFFQPAYKRSLEHMTRTIALHENAPQETWEQRFVRVPFLMAHLYTALSSWMLGFPTKALASQKKALALAEESGNPETLVQGLSISAAVLGHRREHEAAKKLAERAIAVARQEGFPYWLASATALHGRALIDLGDPEAGVSQLREGLAMYQAMGVRLYRPHLLAYLAEGLLVLGEVKEGLAAVDEGLTLTRGNLDRYYEPELWRLKGELLLAVGKAGKSGRGERQAARFCFEQGLQCAVRQESKSLELRCAMSHARLFPELKEVDQAYQRLNTVYRWFDEGFDTQDLKDARAFLKELWKTRSDGGSRTSIPETR